MLLIVNNTDKFFMTPDYSVLQSSATTYPYKCAIVDVLREKYKNKKKHSFVQRILVITKFEGVYIPVLGNIPLFGNAVFILFISLGRIGFF